MLIIASFVPLSVQAHGCTHENCPQQTKAGDGIGVREKIWYPIYYITTMTRYGARVVVKNYQALSDLGSLNPKFTRNSGRPGVWHKNPVEVYCPELPGCSHLLQIEKEKRNEPKQQPVL